MRPPPTAKAPSPSRNAWALRAPARVPLCPGDPDLRPHLSNEVARSHRFKRGSGLSVRVPVIGMVEIGTGGRGTRAAVRAMRVRGDLPRGYVTVEAAEREHGLREDDS